MKNKNTITHTTIEEAVAIAKLPSEFGTFKIYGYKSNQDNSEHVAIVKGNPQHFNHPVMVRIHSECLTGDALGSLRCDCRMQLQEALKMIENAGQGIVIYLQQEGRGIGLINKLKAYSLQDLGLDTVEANEHLGFAADLRDYSMAAYILNDLGLKQIRLITNNPLKISRLQSYDIEIVDRIPLEIKPNDYNSHYLTTKVNKMGHLLGLETPKYIATKEFKIDDNLDYIWSAFLECKEFLKKNKPNQKEYWALYGNIDNSWHFQAFSKEKIPYFQESDFLIIIDFLNDLERESKLVTQVFSQVQSAIVFQVGLFSQQKIINNSQCLKGKWHSNGWQIFSLYLRVLVAKRQASLEKRPFLMTHLAQSLDGKIATINGHSRWLSNEANLKHAHRLRALHDTVMVGAATATLDNPKLTVRLVTKMGKHPTPIIIEGKRDLILDDLEMLKLHEKIIVLYPEGKKHQSLSQETKEKILFLPICPEKDAEKAPILKPENILKVLYENGIESIFLEGGGQTVSYFLQSGCIELLHLNLSPLILGSGRCSFNLPVINSINEGLRFKMNNFNLNGEILLELLQIKALLNLME